MKYTASTLLALAVSASAQLNVSAPLTVPGLSSHFALQLESHDPAYNGKYIAGCHVGSLTDAACIGKSLSVASENLKPGVFVFNASTTEAAEAGTGPGYLSEVLTVSGANFTISDPLEFFNQTTASNVVLPLFVPPSNTGVPVGFNDGNGLYVRNATTTADVYRWYVCDLDFGPTTYLAVGWVMGDEPPQNPSCCKVTIKKTAYPATTNSTQTQSGSVKARRFAA